VKAARLDEEVLTGAPHLTAVEQNRQYLNVAFISLDVELQKS